MRHLFPAFLWSPLLLLSFVSQVPVRLALSATDNPPGLPHTTDWQEQSAAFLETAAGKPSSRALFVGELIEHCELNATRAAFDVPEAAPDETDFDKVVLEENVTEPMHLAVSGDGRVIFVERGGAVRAWDPETGGTNTLATLDVSTTHENGLLGIALDPAFDENHWLYLFYTPDGNESVQRVSRFTLSGEELDLDSEEILLTIPIDLEQCCHSAGGMAFAADGTLYIGTGDNINPFASDGYAPLDERPGRSGWDAQGTAGNTADLRGKILRIRPLPDGGYEIPSGNLFPTDGSGGAPEIYAMGLRNPFRFSIDEETGWLYVGDVGPNAWEYKADRGPRGYDEINRTQTPANFGWPYFIADNKPYRDYDFETGEPGRLFDPENPENHSPNNTGTVELPPARPAWIWYAYMESQDFPEFGPGERKCVFAGPVYRPNPDSEKAGAFPAYYEGVFFFYDWARNWIKTVHHEENGEILAIEPFLPNTNFMSPIDMRFGPDGRMYLIEWGDGYFGGNPHAQIVRIEYNPDDGEPPVAKAQADVTDGAVPLHVNFSSEGSQAGGDGSALEYAWDLNGDGQIDSTDANTSYIYEEPGDYEARLTVTDTAGKTAVATVLLFAGNTRPEVNIEWPLHGGIAAFGDWIGYRVSVTDAEDDFVDPERVEVHPVLGHDDHGHPLDPHTGLEGAFQTPPGGGHAQEDNLFTVLAAQYTDGGAEGVSPLTGRDEILLQPRRKQAQYYSDSYGPRLEPVAGGESGRFALAYIDDGDWASYEPVNLANIDRLRVRVASASDGGTIELRHDALDGPLLGMLDVPNTGGWQEWITMEMDVEDPGDTHELFFVFLGDGTGLFNLNWFEFEGAGMALTYSTWAVSAGSAIEPATPESDPGGYGIPNLLRYAFALDPQSPERDHLPQAGWKDYDDSETRLALTFLRPQWTTDVVYSPEVSTDLADWKPLPPDQNIRETEHGNGLDKVVVFDTEPMDSQPRRFLRLRVSLPDYKEK